MSVTAKRDDVFIPPVQISVLGWCGQPLPQIRCGQKAQQARRQLPLPANDQ